MLEEIFFITLATLECIASTMPTKSQGIKTTPLHIPQNSDLSCADLQTKVIACSCLILHHATKLEKEKLSQKRLLS